MKPLVLVAEDEASLATLLKYNLEQADFDVIAADNGEQAYQLAVERTPDVVLLDWMLPVLSGVDVCQKLRSNAATASLPIILVTARGEESDRIKGLDSGADDYVTKPFSPNELVARIKALLRRSKHSTPGGATPNDALEVGNLRMDNRVRRAWRGDRALELGPTEYKLLRHFMRNPQVVYSREELLKFVWGEGVYVEERTVDVHIRRLRKALNGDGDNDVIRTVRSAGYALQVS